MLILSRDKYARNINCLQHDNINFELCFIKKKNLDMENKNIYFQEI